MSYINFRNCLDKKKEKFLINQDYYNFFYKLQKNIEINDINDLIYYFKHAKNVKYDITEPLIKLSKLVGIKEIKNNIIEQILYYLQDLHNDNDYMHTLICGPPGTGKTELSKIIGELFCNLGILKNKTFRKVTRNDQLEADRRQAQVQCSNEILCNPELIAFEVLVQVPMFIRILIFSI